jgi:hypothetical protein
MASPAGGNCWKCGNSLTPFDYSRQDSCKRCGLDTRVCLNCEHHDRSVSNACREDRADPVPEKERANFCEYFRPKAGGSGSESSSRDAMRKAAEALFKKG